MPARTEPLHVLLTTDGSEPSLRAIEPACALAQRMGARVTFLRIVPELSDAAVARLAALNLERPSSLSTIDVWQLGGAMGRVRHDDTAFPERSAPFLLGIEANWADVADDVANIAWARRVIEEMTPFSTGGSYANFEELRDEGPRAALQASYDRLARVKARYDPTNLFRVNLNVKPTTMS